LSTAVSERPALPLDRFRWITEPLAYWAVETPERIAATDPFASLTFADLQAAVEALAADFEGHSVEAGDRILIVMENSLAGAVAMLAAARLKAWAVPLNARLTAREVDAIRDHCRPRVLVYTAGVSPEARGHAERHGAEPLAALGPLEALVAIDPATSRVLTADESGQVFIWSLQSGKRLATVELHRHQRVISAARFSSTGKRVLLGFPGRWVRLVDSASGKSLASWQTPSRKKGWVPQGSTVYAVAFDAAERSVLAESSNGLGTVWRMGKGS